MSISPGQSPEKARKFRNGIELIICVPGLSLLTNKKLLDPGFGPSRISCSELCTSLWKLRIFMLQRRSSATALTNGGPSPRSAVRLWVAIFQRVVCNSDTLLEVGNEELPGDLSWPSFSRELIPRRRRPRDGNANFGNQFAALIYLFLSASCKRESRSPYMRNGSLWPWEPKADPEVIRDASIRGLIHSHGGFRTEWRTDHHRTLEFPECERHTGVIKYWSAFFNTQWADVQLFLGLPPKENDISKLLKNNYWRNLFQIFSIIRFLI